MRLLRVLQLRLKKEDGCERCCRSWSKTKGHVTSYKSNRGMYPLCEDCWSSLNVEARMPFYKQLLDRWVGLDDPDDPIPSWDEIRETLFDEDARSRGVTSKFSNNSTNIYANKHIYLEDEQKRA